MLWRAASSTFPLEIYCSLYTWFKDCWLHWLIDADLQANPICFSSPTFRAVCPSFGSDQVRFVCSGIIKQQISSVCWGNNIGVLLMKRLSRSTYCSVNTELLNMEYCREHQKRGCWIFSRRQGHKLEGKKKTHTFLSDTFSSSLHFPSFLLSHSISLDNTALIIAELHRDNCSVESRAAAAEAVWENPCCLLQPVCLPADCARFCVC